MGWNVFSIDSLRGSGRGPCLGPVFITSLSKRNQSVRGKKEEPFHEDTLMMKWCKDVCANKGRRKGVRMYVPTKAFCTDQTALHQETPGSRGVSWKTKKSLYIYNMCVYMGMHMYTCFKHAFEHTQFPYVMRTYYSPGNS